jgi:tryptophanyl-tRNA synthetase
MQQIIFIADLIACSTRFGDHYAHHQELESIIEVVAACGIWFFRSTPYRQLENQSTKYHRQQPLV